MLIPHAGSMPGAALFLNILRDRLGRHFRLQAHDLDRLWEAARQGRKSCGLGIPGFTLGLAADEPGDRAWSNLSPVAGWEAAD